MRITNSETQRQCNEWKGSLIPQIDSSDVIIGIDDSLQNLLKENDYIYMLSAYHLNLLKDGNEEEFNIIPENYSFSLLTQEGKSSFDIKAEQFKNAISLASKFNTEGIQKIQSVLDKLKANERDEDGDYRDAEEYLEAINIPSLEKEILEGIDELFSPIPRIIVEEISKVLSTLNPNQIESQRNYIKIGNENPYEYLHSIDALYDENLERDPDYYKR